MGKTVGFYQNFHLDLARLSTALSCVSANPTGTQGELATCMSANRHVAEGFLGWLRHCGLVSTLRLGRSSQTHALTTFGHLVLGSDPGMRDDGTLWLVHYHLVSEHAEKSAAWYTLFGTFLTPGMQFRQQEYSTHFESLLSERTNSSALVKDPVTAVRTYVRPQALQRLALLREQDDGYIASPSGEPPALVSAYMVLDWWHRRYPQTNTLTFDQLCHEPESLGRVCLMEPARVRAAVEALTGLGYLNFSDSQHQPVNRLFDGPPDALLARHYQER